MKKKLLFFCLFLTSLNGFSQNITGDWYGILKTPNQELRIIFHIIQDSGRYLSTLDIPDQGAKRLLMDTTTFSGMALFIRFNSAQMRYRGNLEVDSNLIKGTFSQNGLNIPLVLGKKPIPPLIIVRPQDPLQFPYIREEVQIFNKKANVTLSGTFTKPQNGKFSKVVILIAGSGQNNRDEEIKMFHHRPFLVWSDWLTRHGIAVLRYDKRGTGKSTGNFAKATTFDFEEDARVVVHYIESRVDTKNARLGILGHSEGGLIAPMLASSNKNIKFLVLLAGPGVPLSELMVKQREDYIKISGGTQEQVNASDLLFKSIYAEMNLNQKASDSVLLKKIEVLLSASIKTNTRNLSEQKVREIAQTQAQSFLQPWLRTFVSIQPEIYLSKIECPVLALNGTLDMQVNAEANLGGIESALKKAGNKNFTILPMEGMNHLFQKAVTGGLNEYGQITETVNPMVLEKVSSWINLLP